MNELAKSDVFFVITTLAVVIITILLIVLIIYLIRLSRDIKHITRQAKEQSDLIAGDLNELRQKVKIEGFKWSMVWGFFKKLFKKK